MSMIQIMINNTINGAMYYQYSDDSITLLIAIFKIRATY
jgi:hypothetical protein